MRLKEVEKHYEISWRHNPKQFYKNTFQVEMNQRRLVLTAVVKRHIRKRFRIVGVLKPRGPTR